MKCFKCGHSMTEKQKFCGECGAQQFSKCLSCGEDLNPEAIFCGQCGSKVAVVPSSNQILQVSEASQDSLCDDEGNEFTTTKKLIVFVSSAIEQNKSKIIPFLKEKSGEVSIAALRDDKNIEMLAVNIYAYLPKVVRLAIQEQVFVNFMKENRNKVIELILPKDLSSDRLQLTNAHQKTISDDELHEKIHKIRTMQINAMDKLKSELISEKFDDPKGSEAIIFHDLFFFILDNHIKLVNDNLHTMPFISSKDDISNSAASSQLLTSLLSLYCMSMCQEKFINNIGKELYFQVTGLAISFYQTCAEISARNDIYYDRLVVYYRDMFDGNVTFQHICGVFAKPMYEDHGKSYCANSSITRSELIIELMGTEPLKLPRRTALRLFKSSENIHNAWFNKVKEFDEEIDDSHSVDSVEATTDNAENIEKLSVSPISIPKIRLEDTMFYQFREAYPDILRKQNVSSKNVPLYLALYEVALACAMLTNSFDANSEELKWIVNNDDLLIESYRFVYCTATLMLLEHMSTVEVTEIAKPLLLLPYAFIALKNEPKEKTLGDVLNPQQRIIESGEIQAFVNLRDYKYNNDIEDEDNATYERFAQRAWAALETTYDSSFLYDHVDNNGKSLYKTLNAYLVKYAKVARKDINRKLIMHFSP